MMSLSLKTSTCTSAGTPGVRSRCSGETWMRTGPLPVATEPAATRALLEALGVGDHQLDLPWCRCQRDELAHLDGHGDDEVETGSVGAAERRPEVGSVVGARPGELHEGELRDRREGTGQVGGVDELG